MSHDPLIYPNLDDTNVLEPNGKYETPEWLCKRIVEFPPIAKYLTCSSALDLGCGDGVWGQYLAHLIPDIDGIDVREEVSNCKFKNPLDKFVKKEFVYDNVFIGNFMDYDFKDKKYDLIGFNPPFPLFAHPKTKQEFNEKLMSLLNPYGRIAFILPNEYLHGNWRYSTLWSKGSLLLYSPFSVRIDWTNKKSPRKNHAFYIWAYQRTSVEPATTPFEGYVLNTSNK